jgi:two-component system phosphate regulon sensor histidine kinase PhoR
MAALSGAPTAGEVTAALLRERAEGVRAEAQRAAARAAALESTLNTLQEPVVAVDAQGMVSAVNTATERLLGVTGAGLRGRPLEEVFTHEELAGLCRRAAGGKAASAVVRVARAEGQRVWSAAATPMGGGPPHAVVVEIRDVTEATRALQVKTDFVANASHELRTPIASLRIAVDTLAAIGDEDPAMRERLLGVVASSTARLEEMVRDLLDLSRLEGADQKPSLAPVSFAGIAAELTELYKEACAARKLEIRAELDPALEGFESDRALLVLALSNLLDNATKFAFEGTAVRLVGRLLPGKDGRRVARLEVIDKGIGIPLDQQQRVFERYYQVEAARTGTKRRGTGLGLAIVKHALKQLGGTVRLESVWQEGTRMIVEVPEGSPQRMGA